MRGSVSKYQITLKRPAKRRLVWLTRKRTMPNDLVQRAQIVLLAASQHSIDRKVPRFIAFLDHSRRRIPRGKVIIITDNINTRRGPDARAWLAKHRRFRFVFTPYHGSWLNQVEIWFCILSRKCLRHRSFESVGCLSTAICRFVKRWNETMARPFEWTYTGKVLHA